MTQPTDAARALTPLPSLRAGLSGPPALIFHAEPAWYEFILSGENDFSAKIAEASPGLPVYVIEAEALWSSLVLSGPHLHIMLGPKRHRGARIFHAQPGYVPGYWYLDPEGYYWNASIARADFDPTGIDPAKALRFFRDLRRRSFRANLSKRPQPTRAADPLPPAKAAIFVQDIERYRSPVHHLSTTQILETTAATGGRVYVKPHPLQDPEARAKLAAFCARFGNIEIIEASVHDIIAASEVIISQNSAVGFEALLHRKPVLTCAQSDYHHATLVCRTPQELQQNLARAPEDLAGFPHAKYMYWMLVEQMLAPQARDFAERAWGRLLAAQ